MPEASDIWNILLNLPHPLEFIWLIWLCLLPGQLLYLKKINSSHVRLQKGGELFNYREIAAVGCLGGFPLLTFILAYAASITLEINGVI